MVTHCLVGVPYKQKIFNLHIWFKSQLIYKGILCIKERVITCNGPCVDLDQVTQSLDLRLKDRDEIQWGSV